MDNSVVQLVGGPCGQHGPYTFYKAFKYIKDGVKRIMTLSEFFFVKLWIDSDLVCIGELQLLWVDKNSEQVLASLRLYFLPENTPEGRMDHGEDEVLAISEKVVLRVEDLITWITVDAEWSWGRLGKTVDQYKEIKTEKDHNDPQPAATFSESSLDFTDVDKERKLLDIKNNNKGPSVLILSYPRYCRYRAIMKRLEGVENEHLKSRIVCALGGFGVPHENTRILFCRDTFDYPELEGHELLCNHLAPKLKGRPRGKRKKRSLSPCSESNESECSISNISSTSKGKILSEGSLNGLRSETTISTRRSTRSVETSETQTFLKTLHAFMKTNQTPIGRIPSLGYKELDLHAFYTKVQKLGGYDVVTANRLWKSIFDDLGGNHASTSAATVIRRHYERFLLPYERHVKGEEYKPLPVSERRRLKSKTSRNSASDAETSESTSGSGNSTPVPLLVSVNATLPTGSARSDYKEYNNLDKAKTEAKTSSLRSVRVKPERLRDLKIKEEKPETNSSPIKSEQVDPEEEINLPIAITEKNNEPITTAATPIQKTHQEKSPSPVLAKESTPIFDASDGQHADIEVLAIPYKPKTPEVIDLDSDLYKNISSNNSFTDSSITTEVKKQKLDILKQGGLEVTPICGFTPTVQKERPSVIQQVVTPQEAERISNENRQMPPPINVTLMKRPSIHATSPTTSKHVQSFQYAKGHSPPKVVQSNSIYTPSDKMVYGDPKDIFASMMRPVQAPKFIERPTGGGILDLTVKSPQKPTVEILQIPATSHIPFGLRESITRPHKSPSVPLLDGRKVGSNLEITLVGTNANSSAKYDKNNVTIQANKYANHRLPQKRSFSESYASYKVPRVEDKVRPTYSTQMYHPPRETKKPDFELAINHQRNQIKLDSPNKTQHFPSNQISKQFTLPTYNYPTLHAINKNIPPYLSMVDPIYFSSLQRMYQPNIPLYSPEQYQFYSEVLAHNSRMRGMPFPFAPDGNHSITSIDNLKK